MEKNMIRRTLLLFLCILPMVSGCHMGKTNKINRNWNDFFERATLKQTLAEGTYAAALSLFEAPQTVLISLPLPEAENILYVELYSPSPLNIDRHMLRHYEYMFDFEEKKLHLYFDAPLIYLMPGDATFTARYAVQSATGQTHEQSLTLNFAWMPRTPLKEDGGYTYVDPLKGSGFEGTDRIRATLKLEMDCTDMSRLSPLYREAVLTFVNKGNLFP